MTRSAPVGQRDVANLLQYCVYYASLLPGWPDEPVPSELRGEIRLLQVILEDIWSVLTETTSSRHPGWSADKQRAGYAQRSVGTVEVRVPFFLLPDFPAADDLSVLVDLADRIRINGAAPGSAICVSGSTVLSRSIGRVCDVDFCEYIAAAPSGLRDEVLAGLVRCAAQATDDLICTALRVDRQPPEEWHLAFAEDWNADSSNVRRLSAALEEAERGKLAFLHVGGAGELVEVTTIFLLIDPRWTDHGSAKWSFAAQEAPLTESNWIPRTLTSPLALGRYASWLCDEVQEKLRASDPIKAAKRGVSLARLLGQPEDSDSLCELLNKSGATLYSSLRACPFGRHA